jgi:membrane fusion protein, multidrug efflux system
MSDKTESEAASAHAEETAPDSRPAAATRSGWRILAGRLLSIGAIVAAVVLLLVIWKVKERHPRTDDAVARANVVGIAPRVRGQIIALHVEDNQAVAQGDLLFEIDPDDYELGFKRAQAVLATLDRQIEVARAQDAQLGYQVGAARAGVDRAKAELKQAGDTLDRLQHILPNGFARAEDVDRAETAKRVAASTVAAEEKRLGQAKAAQSELATLIAQRAGAIAAADLAALELSYCKVVAPFPGRVVNLNISVGAFASAGIPVFSLLDTRKWYVMANFREGELPHIEPGTRVELFLSALPKRRFAGTVQGVGWAVQPTDTIDLPHGLPLVKRELNWVHIAQRFPVRIEVEKPDPEIFRMGASAVVTVK